MLTTDSQPCPCGSQQRYDACCGPYLAGHKLAPTAEALMRSRYTAYCRGNVDYLVQTHHPAQRSLDERASLTKSVRTTTWLGLQVLSTEAGQPEDTNGIVEFVARYQKNGQIHERSRFQQRKGRWFYVDGDHLPPVEPKRNEPCWCGSGKKFKQCHGKSAR